nr:nuclear transport factor 2 family protein [Desulfobulbaceae bacterium]
MSQTPLDDTTPNSSFTKFKLFVILVVIFILAFVVYKLAVSPVDTEVTTAPVTTEATENEAAQEDVTEAVSDQGDSDAAETTDQGAIAGSATADMVNPEQDIKEINQFLVDWKSAWQNSASSTGNPDAYFALYADNFTSGKLSTDKWKESKKIRNQGKSWIEVWLSDIRVTANTDGTYRVTFKQEYSSSNFSDKGNKELVVRKSDSGWQIMSEKSL